MTQQLDAPATLTLAERFERLDSPAIADAQRGMRVLHPRLRSLVPGRIIAGPAFTVRAYPGSLMSVMKALVEAPPGVILVVDADGDISAGAVWGEIVADEARQRGLKGIVVDGAARDCRGLRAVGFRLLEAGYEMFVHNRSGGLVAAFVRPGAVAAASPREVGERADLVLTA